MNETWTHREAVNRVVSRRLQSGKNDHKRGGEKNATFRVLVSGQKSKAAFVVKSQSESGVNLWFTLAHIRSSDIHALRQSNFASFFTFHFLKLAPRSAVIAPDVGMSDFRG